MRIINFFKIHCFVQNKKNSNLVPKLSYLDVFRQKIEKHNAAREISSFKFLKKKNVLCKTKIFRIMDQKSLIWVSFELKFEKTIVMFEVSILEFAIMQRFVQKDKSLNLGPKMTYMSIFGLEFQKPLPYLKLVLSN